MTSEFTLVPTVKFFEENNYFGLKASNIIMFEQRMIPAVTFDGKVILENKGKLAMAPGRCYEVTVKNQKQISVELPKLWFQMVMEVCTRHWWTIRCWRT